MRNIQTNTAKKFLSLMVFLAFIDISLYSQDSSIMLYKKSAQPGDDFINSHQAKTLRHLHPGTQLQYGVSGPSAQSISAPAFSSFGTHTHDFLKYAPSPKTYPVNAVEISGRQAFKEKHAGYTISRALRNGNFNGVLYQDHSQKPDAYRQGSPIPYRSQYAYRNEEVLYAESRSKPLWYGVSGFASSSVNNKLRRYDNRHAVGDLVVGRVLGAVSGGLIDSLFD